MSYPDPFTVPPYSDGNAGGFRPKAPMNSDYPGSYSQFDQPPPFKIPRTSKNNPPTPSNPRMNPPIPPANSGTSHIFYKTRRCTKFLEGNCKNGDSCTYAHGLEDLRKPPPNWQELVKEIDDDQRIIHQMKICKKFYKGEVCSNGENCNFLHESPAKFKAEMAVDMATAMARTGQSYGNGRFNKHLDSNSEAIQVNVNANSDELTAAMKNWKTKICSKWKVGMCNYGERCHFAHGESELQQIPDGPSDQPREVMMMNTAGGSIAANQSATVTSFVRVLPAAVPAPIREGGEAKKGFAKWNPNKKINCIYGDWLDDLSPPRSSSPGQDDS